MEACTCKRLFDLWYLKMLLGRRVVGFGWDSVQLPVTSLSGHFVCEAPFKGVNKPFPWLLYCRGSALDELMFGETVILTIIQCPATRAPKHLSTCLLKRGKSYVFAILETKRGHNYSRLNTPGTVFSKLSTELFKLS